MENDHLERNNKKAGKKCFPLLPLILVLLACGGLLAAIGLPALHFVREVKTSAYKARDDLKATLACAVKQDIDGAEAAAAELESDAARLDALLSSKTGQLAAKTPFVETEMSALHKLSSVLDSSLDSLLKPGLALMREHPIGQGGESMIPSLMYYVDFAQEKSAALMDFSEQMDELSAMPCGLLEKRMSKYRSSLQTAGRLSRYAAALTEELLKPGVDLLREYPLEALKTEDGGIRVELIGCYLDFVDEKMPAIRALVDKLDTFELSSFDNSGRLQRYLDTAHALLDQYEQSLKYQPLIRAFIGNGENRLYLFAAQNSSEIRASGGFPGSVGTIRIRDGVLKVEDFHPVTDVLYFYQSPETEISLDEIAIFGDWFRAPRDADFCPDFERVAEIWAVAYKEKIGESVDGVLSATPAIIQRLLAVTGEITLSDGTVLNGENATRMLEYELYYHYFSYGSNEGAGNEISDALFAETAETVMKRMMGELGVKNAGKLLPVLEQCAADRTLMLWMKDENEQTLVREAGLACGLNSDPAKPEAGIYFSLTNPSRMGWFFDMDPSVELLETMEDGSRKYAVHLELRNVMTQQELDSAASYISGKGVRGAVTGYLYLFAPAGGTLGNVRCSDRSAWFVAANYHGLDLQYYHQVWLNPGNELTVDFIITTAPCEQAELALSMTPTLQDYR